MQEVDQRLLDAVAKAIAAVRSKRDALAKEYPGVDSERRFVDANGLLTDAETAKTSSQFDTTLQLLRMSESEFDALRLELAAKAQEAARAAAPPPVAKIESKSAREAVPEAKPKPAAPAKSSECPNGTIRVAAGPFMAGSPADDLLRDATERNYERVEVAAYCIDRYEYPNTKGSRPKVKTSQPEAQKFCLDAGKRLCTEHEWEKACKGPRNNFFPYGKVWDPNICNTETATGEDRTLAPTGSKAQCKSDYDIYDLSGNVLEWTSSSLEQNKTLSIAKGGSYMRPDYAARCAYRYTAPPGTLDAEIGFRCCSDLP
jgi:formylglycine-generating enzyme required for sulfatase activity